MSGKDALLVLEKSLFSNLWPFELCDSPEENLKM